MRDWGRDCWCESGVDNSCGNRFTQQLESLPKRYNRKYVYNHFGFNLKITDMQAAIGLAQLKKLSEFIKNFQKLYNGLKDIKEFTLMKLQPNSNTSWFGFLITLKDGVKFSRNDLTKYLEDNNIQTRNLFTGNILRHPMFESLKEGVDYKVIGELKNTDKIMNDSFWVGVCISDEMIKYIIKNIKTFIEISK